MDNNEIKNLWQAYDKKLEKSLVLNQRIMKEIQNQKASDNINSFLRGHIAVMIFGILWVLFLAFLVINSLHNIYFTISAGAILLFNVYAVSNYAYHVGILKSINLADSILETQKKIAKVDTSFNDSGRLLLLQTPFYCTFWYTQELVNNGGIMFWAIQFFIVALFTFASIYLYKKLDPKTANNKFKNYSLKTFGSQKLQMAVSLLVEIEAFERD